MTDQYGFSDNLGYLLSRCSAQMAARFERELAPHDISLAQWGALLAINETGTAVPSDIAARVGTDRGATTRLLARMEAKGLVARKASATDGRSVVFSLTPQTARKMPDLLALSKAVNAEVLSTLPEADRRALLASLSAVLGHLTA